ncbi:hypothetical protein, partial [Salmonella sp. s55004]|uniref:hypothetical protein n=1 Tax=Salmonella sp. s55004 TaxID=3159675 RepID=UPI00398127ED
PNVLNNINPLPNNIVRFNGLGPTGQLQFASDSFFCYLFTNSRVELFGFMATVTFADGVANPSLTGSCFDGENTVLNGEFVAITSCEICYCNDAELVCYINDPVNYERARN